MNGFFQAGGPAPWTSWLTPPLARWSLYAGGEAVQEAVEVTLTDRQGREIPADLGDYFHYRMQHSPAVCTAERCEPILTPVPNAHHEKLLAVMLREYNLRHSAAPAVRASMYLRTWRLDSQTREQSDRTLLATLDARRSP
jgi:hypothetical protein